MFPIQVYFKTVILVLVITNNRYIVFRLYHNTVCLQMKVIKMMKIIANYYYCYKTKVSLLLPLPSVR